MKSIKIAHIADVHINTPFVGLDEERAKVRRHEIIEAFETALEVAKKQNVEIIAISGDLFDNVSDKRVVKYIVDRLGTCGIAVFIAAGNHDPKREIYDKITLPDNVHVFAEQMECVRFNGVNIYGASFEEKKCSVPLLVPMALTDDEVNILIMHGDVGAGEYNPMDRKLLAQFDYCALGHIHDYSGIVREGTGAWAYSGVCEPRGFDEKGKGGIIIADVSKGTVNSERYIISRREYISEEIDISECRDNLDIIDAVRDKLMTENIYCIELYGADGSFAIMPDYIKKNLEIYCFDIDVGFCGNRNYESLADGHTLRGVFVSKLLDMMSGTSEGDRKKYMRALDIGLDAFEKAGKKR